MTTTPPTSDIVLHRRVSRGLLLNAGIYEDYHECTLASFRGPKGLARRAKKYIDQLPRMYQEGLSFLFHGENNAGKTTLAMIVAKAYLINGYSVRCTNLRFITDLFCSSWQDEDKKNEFHEEVRAVDFLMIDDLNKEFHNRMTHAVLDDVLRHRSNRKLPFIITTNASMAELAELYGNSFAAILERRCIMLEFQTQLKNRHTLIDKNLALLEDS